MNVDSLKVNVSCHVLFACIIGEYEIQRWNWNAVKSSKLSEIL